MAMEHRWSARHVVPAHVRIQYSDGAKHELASCDLSLGGIGMRGARHLHRGARVELSLRFDELDAQPNPLRLSGEVVHDTSGRLGIAFLDADPSALHVIRLVLRRRTPRPAELPVLNTARVKEVL